MALVQIQHSLEENCHSSVFGHSALVSTVEQMLVGFGYYGRKEAPLTGRPDRRMEIKELKNIQRDFPLF